MFLTFLGVKISNNFAASFVLSCLDARQQADGLRAGARGTDPEHGLQPRRELTVGGERLQRSATDQEDGSGESPVPLDDASRLYSRFRLHFDYKAYEADPGAAPLWSEGEDADATWPGECDQRYRGVVRYHFQVEADVLSGVLVGPLYPTVPTRAESGSKWRHEAWQPAVDGGLFDPRMLSFGWLTPVGLLQVGLQTSQFGLGVLANSEEVPILPDDVPLVGWPKARPLLNLEAEVTRGVCERLINGDGLVNVVDLLAVISAWTP